MEPFLIGFFAKTIASFDDMLTRIPVLAALTKTWKGRIAFSIGTLAATVLIILLAQFFASLIQSIPYQRYIIAGIIGLLALVIYFDIFIPKRRITVQEKLLEKSIPKANMLTVLWTGFLISFTTLIDDTIVLLPLFNENDQFLLIAGILFSSLMGVAVVIWFGRKLERFKYKKEVALFTLLLYGFLVVLGVI